MDHFGRSIDPRIFGIAQEIAPQAVSYGDRLLRDSAVAMTLFEEVAANVSQALKEDLDCGLPHVREMRRYLFRSYLRRISAIRRMEPFLFYTAAVFKQSPSQCSDVRTIEAGVLLRELEDCCDSVTRLILRRRLEGYSWKQVEHEFGISANAAALRVKRALRHLHTPSDRRVKPVLRRAAIPKPAVVLPLPAMRLLRAS